MDFRELAKKDAPLICGHEDCHACYQRARVKHALESADFAEMAELIEELTDELCQTSEELNYHEANMDGSWPYAIENLEHALVRAKAHKAAEAAQ